MITQSRTVKTAILASGQVLSACAALIGFAVLSRILTLHDYATYRQTILAYGFVAPVLVLGLPEALYYFMPNEKERARGVLLENLISLCILGAVFSMFLLLGGNRLLAWRFHNPSLEHSLLILAPYPLFMLPAAAFSACLMARDRVKQVAVFNVLSRLVVLIIILAASLAWRTPEAAIWGTVLASLVMLIPSLQLMFKATSGSIASFSISGMLQQLKFSAPLGLASMLGTLALSLDSIIVSSMCPPEQFAIYANGAFEIPLIGIITGSMTSVLLPDLAKHFKQGERAEALALWKRCATKSALVIFPSMIFLFCMAPEVISLLFSDRYAESALPFRFYLFLLPIRIVTFGAMIMAAGESKWVLVRSVGDLAVNAVICVVMVYFFGYIGAIIATIVTIYLWTVPFNTIVISRLYEENPLRLYPFKELAVIFVLSSSAALVFVINYLIDFENVIIKLMTLLSMYILVIILLFVKFKVVNINAVLPLKFIARGR